MSLSTQAIPRLYGGISEQAASQRFPHQHERQTNAHNTVKAGIAKRMPREHEAKLSDAVPSNAYVHTYNRDLNERYAVVITEGDIQVYDLVDGEPQVVFFEGGSEDYLNVDNPLTDLSVVTVGDYTFIVNKKVTVQPSDDTVGGAIDGREQDFVAITRVDDPDNEAIYEVAGDDRSGFDNYYVIRQDGVWREHLRPGDRYKLDEATMPHTLVRQQDGSFKFEPVAWRERLVGDTTSVPFPSFVNNRIEYAFFYRNRLCFLTSQNVVMSRTNEFFNFFPETATDLLDTDPIDIGASSTSVVHFRSAAPHDKTLMLNADQTQFVLTSGDILSPNNVSLDPTTNYQSLPDVDPVSAGPNVYFATLSGSHAAIREYYVEENTATNKAVDITEAVPSLLPQSLSQIETSPNFGMLFAFSREYPRTIWVYNWHWQGNEKIMSAWNEWEFDADILSMSMIDSRLMLLVEYPEGLFLESINLDIETFDQDLEHTVRLDRRAVVTGYEDGGETVWELPYELSTDIKPVVVKGGAFGSEAGQVIEEVIRPDGYSVAAAGDHTAGDCYIGFQYEVATTLSRIFVRRREDNSVIVGRLKLKRLFIAYNHTGYFTVNVSRPGQDGFTQAISPDAVDPETGRIIGSANWTLGKPSINDGIARMYLMADAKDVDITLKNDSTLPSNWHRLSWQGIFVQDTEG